MQKQRRLKKDGLYDTFSGLYVWKTAVTRSSDCLHRREPDGKIVRETLIVTPREKQAELYSRFFDASLGDASIRDLNRVNANSTGSLGQIFLIDHIKRLATRTTWS